MTTMHKATIGSISSGTLRNEDLLQAFADELERLIGPTAITIETYEAIAPDGGGDGDCSISQTLQDVLNEYAPPFCYFGTLEGDGADFGFWPDHDAIQELIRDSEEYYIDGNEGYINIDENVWIQVLDRGNITIFKIAPGEALLSIV